MNLNKLSRDLYLASRTAGDLNAAQHGRLAQRLVRRAYHRTLIRGLRRLNVWK
ncbi:hypothetical protein [Jatrophihabitans sp.]|uniref:hypothetical protein n=1 Tax=Jatrophihabitans sp. TaxID=1932789 RepID=UPI0030C77362|nr:hypothetical protein [Jatrophihabitans sp.]